jgi:hypothetical protein
MIGRWYAGLPLAGGAAGAGLPAVNHGLRPAVIGGRKLGRAIRTAPIAAHSATPPHTETAAVLDGDFCDRVPVGSVLLDPPRVTASGERL